MATIIIVVLIIVVIAIPVAIIRAENARRANFVARMAKEQARIDAEDAAWAARQPAAPVAEARLSQEEAYALQYRLWLEAEASAQVALCNLEAEIARRGARDSWTRYSGAPTQELQVLVNKYESLASRAIVLKRNWEEVKKRGW